MIITVQFSSVPSLSRVRLFVTPWIAARQASLSITNSQSSLRFLSIESVMPSSHLILCHLLLLLPPIPPSIKVFSNESTLHMRWPKYHQNKEDGFLFHIHHLQPQMSLQTAWWVYSGSPQRRAWGKDKYALLDGNDEESMENANKGTNKCDITPCDELSVTSLLLVGCKVIQRVTQ